MDESVNIKERMERICKIARSRLRMLRFGNEVIRKRGDYVRVFVDSKSRQSVINCLKEFSWFDESQLICYRSLQDPSQSLDFKCTLDFSGTVMFFLKDTIKDKEDILALQNGELILGLSNDIFGITEADGEIIINPVRVKSPEW